MERLNQKYLIRLQVQFRLSINSNYQLLSNQMLHQVLCALQGKTGSIIKMYENQIAIDPSVNYLSRPQIQLINQICKCGFYYQKIVSLVNLQFSEKSFTFSISNNPSMYRKAMYEGLKNALTQYVDLILAIEQQFLRNRHFTFANLRADLQPFELIMTEIAEIVYFIYGKNLRGGAVINYLYNRYQNSNLIVRKWLEKMIKATIRVFINQVTMWILYGQIQDPHGQFFIHKVLTQASEKFKFKPKSGRNIEITDWDMFTLEQFMIPATLIQVQTAGKILFIGKSMKILRSANKISSIPDDSILQKINKAAGEDYSQVVFQGAMQEVRQVIARKMIEFIMKEQNLIKQLEKLNSYYLMFKGDFYHHFFEEAKGIQTIAQKQKAQKKINEVYLHNTFIRLGEHQDMKRLHFQLKTLGFSYSNFKNFVNLCPVGNVDLLQGKSIRFNSTGSAVWNRTKQVVENNFTMVFSFNFKKMKQISMFHTISKIHEPTYLSLVLQNCKQISGSTHQNPSYLNRIGQYVAVKVGFEYSQKQKNYVSSMLLVTKDVRSNEKQHLLGICTPKGINLLDQKTYTIKLHYSNDILKAQISGKNGQKDEIKVQSLKLNNYIEFEMGRSYMGFISTINQSDSVVDLQHWEMICKPTSFYNSHWSDLSLNFKVEWPINLIITQDLIEAYGRIHKFLFPIRQLQIQLESIWFQIPRFIKSQKRATKEQMHELKTFQRNLAALRSQIHLVINNFWSYFQADIAQILWVKLVNALESQKDFEDVISSVNKYVKSIQIMYFFNASKIQKKINEVIQKAKSFTVFFNNLINQSYIDESAYNDLQAIDMQFNEKLSDFYGLLRDLSKLNTSQYLYHITKRMEGCLNPKKNSKSL